jgi:hypothetical protein
MAVEAVVPTAVVARTAAEADLRRSLEVVEAVTATAVAEALPR